MPGRGRGRQRAPQRLRPPRRGAGPGRRRGGRRRGGPRRRPGPVRRRAVRREGPRRLRRHAHQPRVARLQGPAAGGRRLDPRRPAAGGRRGADRQDGRPRVRHAELHQDQGVGHHPQPVGPEPHAGRLVRAAARRRWPPGLVPVATASDGGGSTRIPAGFSGLVGLKPSHGRIPHPGPSGSQTAVHGMLTTTVADSARHLDITAGPHDDDRLSLPGRRPSLRGADRDAAGRRAAGPLVGRPRLRRARRPRGGSPGRGRGLRAGRRGRARARRQGRAPHRPGAHLAERRRDGPVVLHRRGHVAGRRRRPHPLLARLARGDRRLPGAASTPARCAAASSSRSTPSALFGEVDVLLTPTTAVPAFPAEGPPPGGAMATPFTMLANLCWNPSISRPRRPHPRRPPGRPPDHRPPPPRRPRPAPGQDLRADPTLAPPRPQIPTSVQPTSHATLSCTDVGGYCSRRKRSTSSAMVSALGTVPGSSSWRSSRLAT